jgi:hypothetical protein
MERPTTEHNVREMRVLRTSLEEYAPVNLFRRRANCFVQTSLA